MSLVSVIIPVHNTREYLHDCVSSVLSQTLHDIEVLLVENMSSDGSDLLCDRLAEKDDRVKPVHIDKADLSTARNYGIGIAKSPYLAFIDSDDIIEPDMLEKMYAGIVRHSADIAVCNYDWVFDDGTSVPQYEEKVSPVFYSSCEFTYRLLKERICSSACVCMCKKSLFAANGIAFPADRYYEDRATTYKLAASAVNGGVWIPETLYHYMQRSGSICHTMNFRKFSHCCLADIERLEFVSGTALFNDSTDKRKDLHDAVLSSFIWAFNQMLTCVRSKEEKDIAVSFRKRFLEASRPCWINKFSLKIKYSQIRWAWWLYYPIRSRKATKPMPR